MASPVEEFKSDVDHVLRYHVQIVRMIARTIASVEPKYHRDLCRNFQISPAIVEAERRRLWAEIGRDEK